MKKTDKKEYYYGMTLRPFSIGCQPMTGFIKTVKDGNKLYDGKYHDILVYDRKLSDKEIEEYELEIVDEIHIWTP